MDQNPFRRRVYAHYVSVSPALGESEARTLLIMRAPYMRRLIRRHFPADRNAKIIDLGCGPGTILHFAREMGYANIEGIDCAPEQVATAHHLGITGVHLGHIIPTINALPSESVDTIVTFDVIEHLCCDELATVVDGVHRVVKAGGRWIIHVPNGEALFGARMRYWDVTHEMAYTRNSMSQVLRSSGWKSVECFEDTPPIHGAKSLLRAVLWRGLRICLIFTLAVEGGDPDWNAILSQNLLAVAYK